MQLKMQKPKMLCLSTFAEERHIFVTWIFKVDCAAAAFRQLKVLKFNFLVTCTQTLLPVASLTDEMRRSCLRMHALSCIKGVTS